MALTGVIARFKTATSYTVTRTAAGSYTTGLYTSGATSTFTIVASIQPFGMGRNLEAPVDGQHGSEVRVLWTTTELRTRAPLNDADTISIDSETWRVVQVERWQAFGEAFYQVRIARVTSP